MGSVETMTLNWTEWCAWSESTLACDGSDAASMPETVISPSVDSSLPYV